METFSPCIHKTGYINHWFDSLSHFNVFTIKQHWTNSSDLYATLSLRILFDLYLPLWRILTLIALTRNNALNIEGVTVSCCFHQCSHRSMGWLLWLVQTRRQKVCREMQIEMPSTSQADILQRLIRRYLFKLERMKEEGRPTTSELSPDSIRHVNYSKTVRKAQLLK